MGDGKKLKSIIDERGITVTELARAVGMNQQTIYSIIKRDSKIRYDFALRIANEL
ncbi:MAG: helix-turn-helix transcriptional regulator, partial [Oscillospiraceae bacterium]|nr:helix-turn-helix transcriptional regulator [Oscillospiraceae bacterium]